MFLFFIPLLYLSLIPSLLPWPLPSPLCSQQLAAEEKRLAPYHIFSPAYILAPIKESRGTYKEAQEALGVPREKSTILNCTYCLSEDQRWLLATATDDLGEILETVTISIEIPNR